MHTRPTNPTTTTCTRAFRGITAAGLIALLLLTACVPPAARKPETIEPSTDASVYAKAQQAYMQGALHTALNYYQVVVQNFLDFLV